MDQEIHRGGDQISHKIITEVVENCEFITSISMTEREQQFLSMSLVESYQKKNLILPIYYRRLAVQFFYLLYSCRHKKIVPISSKEYLRFSEDRCCLMLHIHAMVNFEKAGLAEDDEKMPYFNYFLMFIRNIYDQWKEAERLNPVKTETLTINKISKDLETILESNRQNESNAFSLFQKTDMFIESSMLYKLKTNCIICLIRNDQNLIQKFRKARKRQNELLYQLGSILHKKHNDRIVDLEQNIIKNMQAYFQEFNSNPLFSKLQQKHFDKHQNGVQNKSEISFCLKVFECIETTNSKSMQEEDSNFNQFRLEYCQTRNIVTAKYITDIVMDWMTSDTLLFKWNSLTFESSNLTLETIQRIDQSKKIKKYLVVKGRINLNKNEAPIQKMLIIADICMVTFKTIQNELRDEIAMNKIIQRLQESSKKVNHYIKLMRKICMKGYSILMKQ